MGYKKCPRCDLNWIDENEDYCEVCKKDLGIDNHYKGKTYYQSPFPMKIVITRKRDYVESYKGNGGMEGYILKDENDYSYGVVFHTYEGTDREQDRVEIRYYNELSDKYGFWHRLNLSDGNEFRWSYLQRVLQEQGVFKGYVY